MNENDTVVSWNDVKIEYVFNDIILKWGRKGVKKMMNVS